MSDNLLSNPVTDVQLALKLLDIGLQWIARLKAQSGMSTEDILTHADGQDLSNLDKIKVLIAN